MPALPPYIPQKDADFAAWASNFSTLLTATPSAFAQTPATAADVAAAEADWAAAYALITSPSTKTPAAVSAKNTQRTTVTAVMRPVAQQISLSAGVTSDNKIAIGVNPRTSTPQQITAPTTYPSLSILQSLALAHIIAYRDNLASPTVKAKPYGVTQMLLYGKASATPITDPTALDFLGSKTKSPLTQAWTSAVAGQKVYYSARWQTRSGLVGPWAPIVSFIVAA